MSTEHLGQTIAGKYQLRRLLGEGGMGAVYEGLHLEIGKRVAIKTISTQRAHVPELAARFKREARVASAIESENIVQVFDVGHDPQIGLYMVMEHLVGEDLATRLHRERRLDPMTALAIMAQALHGLERAHAAGIVHRDLKPANLFLVDRGAGRLPLVKILDFGISKFLRDERAADTASVVTRAGAVMGTALYMSPEQAQGGALVDHRSDLWSIGAVLYEMLAGRTPHPLAQTYEGMIVRIVTTPPWFTKR
jgi:serine/threonine-protein kinase